MKKLFSSLVVLSTLAIICQPRSLDAAEPAREFLDALRQRKYYDTALDYLDQMETSPLAPAFLKQTLDYERGINLVDYARSQRDSATRGKLLDQAKKTFDKFISANPQHSLSVSAKHQLANLLVERARINIDRSNRKNTSEADKKQLLTEARGWFDEAHTVFTTSRDSLKTMLEQFPPTLDPNNPNDKRRIEIRKQFRGDYLQARLLIPAIEEEKADTFSEGAKEREELLLAAAENFGLAYTDYRTLIGGLYARMYQGRCYLKLKNYSEALSYFDELFEQPDDHEAFRKLKKQTLMLAVECWLNGEEKVQYLAAINQLGKMIEKLRPNEGREEDWLYLRLALAKAHKAYADDVEDKKEQTTQLNSAVTQARYVSKYPSNYKRQAQEFLASIRGVELAPEEKTDPTSFVQAKDAGKEALDNWQTAKLEVAGLQQQIAKEKDQKVKAELEMQLADAAERLQDAPKDALKYYRMALDFVDYETPSDDIGIVQYFMSYLYFTFGQYHEAGLMGEFAARRYPSSPAASQCAQIALAAYVQLYKSKPKGDQEFESNLIINLGDFIIQTWPSRPETIVAANTLIAFMINAKRIEDALRYLEMIPVDSPNRGGAELSTGQAMWTVYLDRAKSFRENGPPQGSTEEQETARLEQIKNQSKSILSAGIDRMREGATSETLVTAALSLAQLHVDIGESAEAVTLLTDPKIGPLTLVDQDNPATKKKGLNVETYKTALRAYIGSLKPGDEAAINKAKGLMARLKELMGDSEQGRKNLVATYFKLASDIKQQFDNTPPAQRQTMAVGFASFLKEVRDGADELDIHMWAADSFSKLGESMQGNVKPMPANVKDYYQEAVNGFNKILEKGKTQEGWLPPEIRTQVQIRKASTLRNLGNHKEALDVFAEVLRQKSSMLNIQVEAARTLQAWGEEDPDYYYKAIMGSVKDTRATIDGKPNPNKDKNIVWGWGKLGQITQRYLDKFPDVFFESRMQFAACRFDYGKAKKSKKDIEKARGTIESTHRSYKNKLGAEWTQKYDRLLKSIQRELGDRNPKGLAASNSSKTAKK